jgi:hypothetical protein
MQIDTCDTWEICNKGHAPKWKPVDQFNSRRIYSAGRRIAEQSLREDYRFPEQEKWSNTTRERIAKRPSKCYLGKAGEWSSQANPNERAYTRYATKPD